MSKVRVLVGTRKGAFILTSDGKRDKWEVSGPHFAGWEIYHMKGSPVDPDRLYASQTSGWFGQIIQRSDDGGQTWQAPGGEPAKMPEVPLTEELRELGYFAIVWSCHSSLLFWIRPAPMRITWLQQGPPLVV